MDVCTRPSRLTWGRVIKNWSPGVTTGKISFSEKKGNGNSKNKATQMAHKQTNYVKDPEATLKLPIQLPRVSARLPDVPENPPHEYGARSLSHPCTLGLSHFIAFRIQDPSWECSSPGQLACPWALSWVWCLPVAGCERQGNWGKGSSLIL